LIQFQPEIRQQKSSVRVGKGDNLTTLAHRLRVPVLELAQWNRLTPQSKVQVGQTLIVYRPVLAAASKPPLVSKPNRTAGTVHKSRQPVSPRNPRQTGATRKK
jgi:membrane-bound lytic murein transglycosylase D